MKKFISISLAALTFVLVGAGCSSDNPSGLTDTIQKSDVGRLDGAVSFTEPRLCVTPVNETCSSDVRMFGSDTEQVWFSTKFSGLKDGQKVRFAWQYISGPLEVEKPYTIDSLELVVKKEFTELHTNLTKPTSGWPEGEYKVAVSVDGENKDFLAQRFTVK
jgi:hypothetical protein